MVFWTTSQLGSISLDLLQSICLPLIIFFVFCSAFFSGSETALFSLGRWKLIRLREEGHPKYSLIEGLQAGYSFTCGSAQFNIVKADPRAIEEIEVLLKRKGPYK